MSPEPPATAAAPAAVAAAATAARARASTPDLAHSACCALFVCTLLDLELLGKLFFAFFSALAFLGCFPGDATIGA